MSENLKLGTIVKVIVSHPDGCNADVYGDVGVIQGIETIDKDTSYEVNNFVYSSTQIRELTDEECRYKLAELLIRRNHR